MQRVHIVVEPCCRRRQFAAERTTSSESGEGCHAGAVLLDIPVSEFEEVANSRYDPSRLADGRAPLCEHLFAIDDFTADAGGVGDVPPIAGDNERHHQPRTTRCEGRTEGELQPVPTIVRHPFDGESPPPDGGGGKDERDAFLPAAAARYLDLILYSREQIEKENDAAVAGKTTTTPSGEEEEEKKRETAPWGIVSIKARDADRELLPAMTPIAVIRDAPRKDRGGGNGGGGGGAGSSGGGGGARVLRGVVGRPRGRHRPPEEEAGAGINMTNG
jgi:hypothetical protein